jgi:hypothetical protein
MSIARLAEFGRMDSPSSTEAVHIRQPRRMPCSNGKVDCTMDFSSLHVSFTTKTMVPWLLSRLPS